MSKRILYLDVLKVIAALAVIFNHTHFYIQSDSNLVNFIHLYFFGVCKVAVPLFIMTTGVLFLKRETGYKEIFTKRIPRVLCALVIASMIFSLYNGHNPLWILLLIFQGGDTRYIPYWFWYIYMLMGIYIMTPFLQKMIKSFKDKDFKIFIFIFLIFLSFLKFLPTTTEALFGYSFGLNNNFINVLFTCVIGYYVAGYYINKQEITKKENFVSICVFLVITLLGGVYLYYCYNYSGNLNDSLMEYNYFPVAIASICLFVSFKYYLSKNNSNNFLTKIITISSFSSFGIYLFHEPLIGILHDGILSSVYSFNSLLGVIINVVLVFVILDIVFYFVKKIPIVQKIF